MNRTGGLPEGVRYQQVSTQEPQPKLALLCVPFHSPSRANWAPLASKHGLEHETMQQESTSIPTTICGGCSLPYAVAVSTDGKFQCSTAQGYGGQANP